jgi:hypothetical protein
LLRSLERKSLTLKTSFDEPVSLKDPKHLASALEEKEGCAVTIVRHYAQHLRVIGQAIEARNFAVYEIVHLSEWYVINGIPDETGSVRSKVRHWLRRLRQEAPPQSFTLDLTEIEKLSEAGRARRSTPGRLTDLASVSNSLRTIGAYLDAREVELFELKKKEKFP